MSNWFVDEMPGEVPFEEIKKRSSEYHDWGFVPETMQEIGYESVNEKLKTYTAEKYEAFDDAGKEQMVNDVLAIYRSIDLLPIQYYSELGVMNEIEKCIAYKAQFDGDTVSCVDGETEFFTGKGWKKIRDFVKGDKVLQYNEDGSGQLVDPIRYIHYKSDDPFYEYDNGVFNSCLTGNHDVVFEDCNSKCFKMKMKDVVEKGGKVDAFVPIALSCMFRDDNLTVYGGKDFFVLLTKLIHEKSEIKDGYFVLKDSYDWHGSDSVAPSDLKERLKCLEDDEVIWYFVIGDCGTNLYLKGDILNKCLEVKDGVVVDFSTNLYNLDRWSIGDFLAAVSDERGAMHKELSPRAYDLAQFFSIITGNAYYVSEFDEFAEGQDYLEALKETGSFLEIAKKLGYSKGTNPYKHDLRDMEGAAYYRYKKYSNYSYGHFREYYDEDKYCFEVPSHMLVLRRKGRVFVTGNCGAGVGTTLCNYLFPNLFDVPSQHDLDKKGAETLFAKFHNDEYLKKAIKFCFSYKNGCPVPTNVMGGLRLVGSAPTNFRPMNAKAVYERFCPEGGTIYDFCCGFGGRMLGALSSKRNFRYVGTDPCTETMYHLHELGDYIEMVTGRDDSYELHCCGSEDFRGPAESIDFAFSSPPYFNLEVYSDEETQCFNKFPVLEDWLEGYVRATIKNIYHMLKRGAVYAVNIADFTVGGGKVCAYVDEWIRISTEEGMSLYDTVYLGVTARAGSAQQAAGELKKENILIFKKPI